MQGLIVLCKVKESDNELFRACAITKSGSRSPVSNSFSFSMFSRMLSWKRAVVTEEDLMQSAIN